MVELAKIIGALAWVVGIFTIFLVPPLGIIALLVAVLITIYTVTKTREQRHQEVVHAALQGQESAPAQSPLSVSERLEELSRLKEQGAITEEEHEAKRREIIDEL